MKAEKQINKKIVLGVSGSIAAYKACDIVSSLKKMGYDIHVVMTDSAKQFVSEMTFWNLSGNNVVSDMWEKPAVFNVEHVSLAQSSQLILIAPATANIIAKIAHGICDDMLSTVCLAARCPVVIAPAMNTAMYENPVTQENIALLKKRGVYFIEPATGILACGDMGIGKLAPISDIAAFVNNMLSNNKTDFSGRNIIVSAGATIAPIDPVRFISNHSSGKMGASIASAAIRRGANVFFVAGECKSEYPVGAKHYKVSTNEEMYNTVKDIIDNNSIDAFISAAAPCDFTVDNLGSQKIKKSESLTLNLTAALDILLNISQLPNHPVLVGFAAETQNLIDFARYKLEKKNLDMIVANDVSGDVFGSDYNQAHIILKDGDVISTDRITKLELADIILDNLIGIL